MLTELQASDAHARLALLMRLFQEQAATSATHYLHEHAEPATVAHHVNVFEWYAPYLERRTTVLDWGCNHGPDSCLLRHRFGDALNLHACDFAAEEEYGAFRAYARARYERLSDPLTLPYADDTFDAVVGSGTLEHTAMDGESLKELHRVMRTHGALVITFLPHAYSWSEWRRRVAGHDYHRRLYTRRGLASLLTSHGFEPQRIELQGFVPNKLRRRARSFGWRVLRPALQPVVDAVVKPVLRPLRYPFFRHDVLCCVARKMTIM